MNYRKWRKRETIKIIKKQELFRSMQLRAPDRFVCVEKSTRLASIWTTSWSTICLHLHNHILHTMFGGKVHRIATKICFSWLQSNARSIELAFVQMAKIQRSRLSCWNVKRNDVSRVHCERVCTFNVWLFRKHVRQSNGIEIVWI